MRVLVTGGRDYSDRATVFRELDKLHAELTICTLIHGAATGADKRVKRYFALNCEKWGGSHDMIFETELTTF